MLGYWEYDYFSMHKSKKIPSELPQKVEILDESHCSSKNSKFHFSNKYRIGGPKYEVKKWPAPKVV